MKIKVKPEGRPNIWIPEKKSLIAWIKSKKFKQIHNFIPSGPIIIGADHDVDSVLDDVKRADRLALFTDDSNMKHAMALIFDDRLEMYDIGDLTLDDLQLIK